MLCASLSLAPENTQIRHHLYLVLVAPVSGQDAVRELERILLGSIRQSRRHGSTSACRHWRAALQDALARFEAALNSEPANAPRPILPRLTLQLLGRSDEAAAVLGSLGGTEPSKNAMGSAPNGAGADPTSGSEAH